MLSFTVAGAVVGRARDGALWAKSFMLDAVLVDFDEPQSRIELTPLPVCL